MGLLSPSHERTYGFAVPDDRVWAALVAALPSVTHKAGFFDGDHRVEWISDTTGISFPREYAAAVEPSGDGR